MSKIINKKIAVILFNLGCPSSKETIENFLMNFFMDKNIISAPLPLRYLLAKYISKKRSRREASETYGEIGNKSPLLDNTNAQRDALSLALGSQYKVFTCMRYSSPFADEVIKDVEKWGANEVILLPLYPQYSITTTGSAIENWQKTARKLQFDTPTKIINNYHDDKAYIEASADNIIKLYDNNIRILFSAHGLPEKIIKKGDPYQTQCERSADLIAKKLNHKIKASKCEPLQMQCEKIDYQICYQSRVGRLKWIEPSIETALKDAARDNKSVIIYPHAFTQEHVETLVELDIEYKNMADNIGIAKYHRAQTLGVSEKFIAGLAALVSQQISAK